MEAVLQKVRMTPWLRRGRVFVTGSQLESSGFYYDAISLLWDRQTVIKDAITTVYVAAQYFCVRIIKTLWIRICLFEFCKSFRSPSTLKYVAYRSTRCVGCGRTYRCKIDYCIPILCTNICKPIFSHHMLIISLFRSKWFVYVCLGSAWICSRFTLY